MDDNVKNMKNIKKTWLNSLGFLDNCYINSIIVIILVLYSSTIFENINNFIGSIYNYSIVKIIILLLIIYVAPKDSTIAILLGISYLVSLNYAINTENFSSPASYPSNGGVTQTNTYEPANGVTTLGGQTVRTSDAANTAANIKLSDVQHDSFANQENERMFTSEENEKYNKLNRRYKMHEEKQEDNEMSNKLHRRYKIHEERQEGNESFNNRRHESFNNRKHAESFNNRKHAESFNNRKHYESFVPNMMYNDNNVNNVNNVNNDFNQLNNNQNIQSNVSNSKLNADTCLQNYTPMHESIGDVCSPVATFTNELNAQGLNYPEGYGYTTPKYESI